jgi:hypothetical protein
MRLVILLLVLPFAMSCQEAVSKSNAASTDLAPLPKQTSVLVLGSFHFNFPNLDIAQTDENDKIDVLDSIYQQEIEHIVSSIETFKPTKIVIEREPQHQSTYDSLYQSYLDGKHILSRSEEQQIGFRLAKNLNLPQIYCVDAWGADYDDINQLFESSDTIAQQDVIDYIYTNPDSPMMSFRVEKPIFKTEGIIAELTRLNSDDLISKSLGDYLIGIFKYETETNDQFGADFTTGWWFNRNLRIFRNIQRIEASPDDRILVIYGAGHLNLLNLFFESSPEYRLHKLEEYLH